MKLANEEYNVLIVLSNKAKMDWFNIETDNNGNDYIMDYEENKKLDLKTGILMLDSGLTDIDDYDLKEEEKEIYKKLIKKAKGNKILYAKNYAHLPNYISYEDVANKNNIITPKQVLQNVAYFDLDEDKIGYFGTAKVGEKTRPIILDFFNKLKTVLGDD